jgi:hypothetical protein
MAEHELTRFPPVLQIVALALLAGYVFLSVLGRWSRRFRRMLWADPAESRTPAHLFVYTLVPGLILAVAVAAVALNWDASAPLDGGWSVRQLTLGPVTAALGMIVIVVGKVAGQRIDTSDASAPGAWIPVASILLGIVLLAVGVTTFGRTVKRMSGDPLQSPAARVQDRKSCTTSGFSRLPARRPLTPSASSMTSSKGCGST